MRKRMIFVAPLAIVGIALFIAIGGWIVQHLWNWLLPPLFGWRMITFWQALALLVLCRILFGGFSGHGHRGWGMRRRVRERIAERMGERWAERWEKMTPEEREKFRQGMRGRCGFGEEKAATETGA
jgi:MFS family permease